MADIQDTTGIPAACGIGTNLYLAKVAMDITAKHAAARGKKGNRRTGSVDLPKDVVGSPAADTFLAYWAGGFPHVWPDIGIYTMGDIALASLQQEDLLYRLFGVDAELLIDHAWGEESCTMEDIKGL